MKTPSCFEPDDKFRDCQDDTALMVGGWQLPINGQPLVCVLQPRHYGFAGGESMHLSLDEAERMGHKLLAVAAAGRKAQEAQPVSLDLPAQCPWCGKVQIRLDAVNEKGHIHCDFCRDKCRYCNKPPYGDEWGQEHD